MHLSFLQFTAAMTSLLASFTDSMGQADVAKIHASYSSQFLSSSRQLDNRTSPNNVDELGPRKQDPHELRFIKNAISNGKYQDKYQGYQQQNSQRVTDLKHHHDDQYLNDKLVLDDFSNYEYERSQLLQILSPEDMYLPHKEVQALYDLYQACHGQYWKWRELSPFSKGVEGGQPWVFPANDIYSANPCYDSWQGIVCSCNVSRAYITDSYYYIYEDDTYLFKPTMNCSVIALLLIDYNITGVLPDSMGDLQMLQSLDLKRNAMFGSIPSSLFFGMTSIQKISLAKNSFSSSIPSSIGIASTLRILRLDYNLLEGALPVELSGLKMLEELAVGNNYLSGQLPTTIGDMPSLIALDITTNQVTGPIPSSICNLSRLISIDISFNSLSGEIPACFYSMTDMVSIAFSYNNFDRQMLPESIGNFSQLNFFGAQQCNYEGTIPSTIGKLSLLESFDVASNFMTSSLPSSIGSLSILSLFFVFNNSLTGNIPSTISRMTKLQFLYLHDNNLVGNLQDSQIYSIASLQELTLTHNMLTGSIPFEMHALQNMRMLLLGYNNFVGSFPSGLFDNSYKGLHYLQMIDVSHNAITGTIPLELFQLANISSVTLNENCITGSLPLSICSSVNLISLQLDGVATASACRALLVDTPWFSSYSLEKTISGGIPPCIFGLPSLVSLHMAGNGIDGSLTVEDGIVGGNLTDLVLSHNYLTGTIPLEIQHRTSWVTLDLGFNKFTGSLSQDISLSPNAKFDAQVNRLSGPVPSSLISLRYISILAGNSFSCSVAEWSKSIDLPLNDPYLANFICEGVDILIALIFWSASIILLLIICSGVLLYYRRKYRAETEESRSRHAIHWWLLQFKSIYDFGSSYCQSILQVFHENTDHIGNIEEGSHSPARVSLGQIKSCGLLLRQLNRATIVSTCLIVVILAPTYVVLKSFPQYSTHAFNNVYIISANFLESEVPAIVLGISMISLLLVIQRVVIPYFLHFEGAYESFGAKEMNHLDFAPWIKNKCYHWKQFPCFDGVLLSKYGVICCICLLNFTLVGGVNALFIYATTNQFYPENTPPGEPPSNTVESINEHNRQKLTYFQEEHRLISIQIILSILNTILMPCVAIMIISPQCFVYALIENAPVIESEYLLPTCKEVYEIPNSTTIKCMTYMYYSQFVLFTSPFLYTYQCSDALLTSYSAVFVFYFLITTFVSPLRIVFSLYFTHYLSQRVSLERIRSNKALNRILTLFVPKLLWPVELFYRSVLIPDQFTKNELITDSIPGQVDSTSLSHLSRFRIINFRPFVVQLYLTLALIFSFGMIFPLLAMFGAVSTFSQIYCLKFSIGYLYRQLQQQLSRRPIRILIQDGLDINLSNRDLKTDVDSMHLFYITFVSRDCLILTNLLPRLFWLAFPISYIIIVLYIFDITGANQSISKAAVGAIVVLVSSIVAHIGIPFLMNAFSLVRTVESADPSSDINNLEFPEIQSSETSRF